MTLIKTNQVKNFLLTLLFTGVVNAQIINIPDANFKSRLVSTNCAQIYPASTFTDVDSNNDGEIDVNEASAAIGTLNLGGSNIASLEGIQYFTNLGELFCDNNQITTLDLTGMAHLGALYCSNNGMTSLIINQTELTALYCSNNLLTQIDFKPTMAPGFEAYIDVSNNLLTSLYFPDYFDMFDTLNISGNLFTSFSVVSSQLQYFNCSNSPNLVSLDFSGVSRLFNKGIMNNPNLQYINFKNGWVDFCDNNPDYPGGCHFTDSSPVLTNNPALLYICADEQDLAGIQAALGAQSVAYSTYCSFTPEGNYNTITGTILFDADNNGCDASDIPWSGIKVDLGNFGSTFTSAAGSYTFYTGLGNYTITPSIENPTFFTFSPIGGTIDFVDDNFNSGTQDFCISANGIHPDLEIALAPVTAARPGFDARYEIIYRNKGNQLQSGQINLSFNDAIIDMVSAAPAVDNAATNLLTWNFSNLQPFETRAINLTLNVNSPVESPPVASGDILSFTCQITNASGEETPSDNTFDLNQTVVNSLDPNDKACLEGGTVTVDNIGKYLHYNINFENTGTSNAVNVVVKDIIDTTKFDINSLQLLYASNPVETKITGNKVEFIFENINLPPSSVNPIGGHGNVLFKIKTLPTLTIGNEVSNTANIYFDYNAPIDTNEARTAFTSLAKTPFVKDKSVTVYPNPAKNKVSVKAGSNIRSVQLYDVQGRILETLNESKKEVSIDLSQKQKGIYSLKVFTQTGSSIEKIIKE